MALMQKEAWHIDRIAVADQLAMHDQSEADVGAVAAFIVISHFVHNS